MHPKVAHLNQILSRRLNDNEARMLAELLEKIYSNGS